jgi:hypothetical protein
MFRECGHLKIIRLVILFRHSILYTVPGNTAGNNILKSF